MCVHGEAPGAFAALPYRGRVSDSVSPALQPAQGIPCLCLLRLALHAYPAQHVRGFWGSELRSFCFCSKCYLPGSRVLVRVSIAVKRHHDHSNSYKGKHLTGAGLQFRDLVNYHHGRKHSGVQADVVLEREQRVLHLDYKQQKERERATGSGLCFLNPKAYPQ